MTAPMFKAAVDDAVTLGFDTIFLTPMLGDVFADPKWPDRFALLDAHDGIAQYAFFTNFVLPSRDAIEGLDQYRKLDAIFISIYGHDPQTFCDVTQKPAKQYDRLCDNLDALAERMIRRPLPGGVHLTIRTVNGLTRDQLPASRVIKAIDHLERSHGAKVLVAEEYDNWGGVISKDDVAPVGISLTDGAKIYKHGACRLLFSSPQIMADGTVHACACRDVDGSLTLGHVDDAPLASLLSSENPKFRKIFDEQQRGHFGPNCKSCSLYRSVEDDRAVCDTPAADLVRLADALKIMR